MASLYIPVWVLLTQILMHFAKTGAKVPAIIVFGDSSVDAGNNNVISTLLKSNFQPYGRDFFGGRPTGRFSNGRIPPDFISEAFGLKPSVPAYLDSMYSISDFATGVCFASAGTGYDNATSDVLNVIPLWQEVEYYKEYQNKLRAYLGRRKANRVLSGALYLVSLGTNDFLENYYIFPQRQSQFTVEQYQDFIVGLSGNFLREIYSLGARKISLTGLPPMGCLPLERSTNLFGHECVEDYNKVALEFNGKLKGLVKKLNEDLPRLKLVFTESAYDAIYQIIKKPTSYGFDVARVACCSTGTFEMSYLCSKINPLTCTDANKYVFWDAFHPTERTNKIIVDNIIGLLLKEFNN
ncbi:hypothetical protein FNV43_RR13047 [Rhamnella rubrinervis]|uniref:GDSL esterase/lipase n=1 Tax=Rhamnella rubrinervis TaxID=2594499 RepID=A0A8K0H0F2_9ROSA|nr:hypothetical protein FNV43_RR13047 [Rhamnella rubrinervis]